MKIKFKSILVLISLLIIWEFLLIYKFDNSQSFYDSGNSVEFLNINNSNLKYTNATIISDLYGGIEWNE
jgi:hypothetical protein